MKHVLRFAAILCGVGSTAAILSGSLLGWTVCWIFTVLFMGAAEWL